VTIALDVTITEELQLEGLSREVVNRIQQLRKQKGLDVTDQIQVDIAADGTLQKAIEAHRGYISQETLAKELRVANNNITGEQYQIHEHEIVLTLSKSET
jgi:isoleucyl-tRNA synthetase